MIFLIMQAVRLFTRQQFICSVIAADAMENGRFHLMFQRFRSHTSLGRFQLHSRYATEDCTEINDSQNDCLSR